MKIVALLFLLAGGCAANAGNPGLPLLPAPTCFNISGTFDIKLTTEMVAKMGLPGELKGTLAASARSYAVSASPMQSHHEGNLTLIVTDGSGKQSLANVNISVNGESAGTPTEGLSEALNRFMDAASLMSRPVPQFGQTTH